MTGLRVAGGIAMALTLAACASTPFAAPNAMAGHWKLSAPNAPFCDMSFDGEPGADQGTIRPDGGCPGEMFRSRSWALAKDTLTIGDDQGQPLATLQRAAGGFRGTSAAGLPVTLNR
jgi:Protease inhibitor Inh